jgi:hypothetical protein
MAHETTTGSSPIVRVLMLDLQAAMPDAQREKLQVYWAKADATTPEGDFHRARECLRWAVRVAEMPEHSHLSHLSTHLKETYKAWQDIVFGTEFGSHVKVGAGPEGHDIRGQQKIGPGEDIEILWVGEAVSVAKTAAEKSGWDQVPWEQLVKDVLAVQ